MSEPLELTDVWRRTLEATVQFYSAMGELAADLLQTLLNTTTGVGAGSPDNDKTSSTITSDTISKTSRKTQPAPTMMLEGIGGDQAVGLFLVENRLSRAVTASPSVSTLLGDDGRQLDAVLAFEPTSMTLAPGEQILVRVVATIAKDLEPGIRYRGEISVPGLLGTTIPIALERTEKSGAPVSPRAKASAASRKKAGGKRPKSRRKTNKRSAKN